MVMDMRSGEILYSRNADTRLHPASLTKMMTLYVVFEAVERGEITLDTEVKISKHAASEPPSKLGLRSGQRIKLRYLIRAAAVKSANDAATALGEAISGSEAAFAERMTRTARALGMTSTTFKNAHGLTESGHLSTARDMTIMGRHLFYDYQQYYNLFSRTSTDAGVREVANTNRRFLAAYEGADGIKTGYTNAAGFNLVASAVRGNERVIATMFGGRSTAQRNQRVAELLDLGFTKAPTRVATIPPGKPRYTAPGAIGTETRNVVLAVVKSIRPMPRPSPSAPPTAEMIAAIESSVAEAVVASIAADPDTDEAAESVEATRLALATAPLPQIRPETIAVAAAASVVPAAPEETPLVEAALDQGSTDDAVQEVVERMSTSGGRHWGINIGRYPTRYQAEQVLLKTALAEIEMLDEALRKVVKQNAGFEANFVGMTKDHAALACRRLVSRAVECSTLGPSG
ncbi:D-alanyl-D-alanine carboxypeptidase family protein [Anianabacter salinae]|uniref:D-alanyl-D-alanine carboxypeptidase family protein n=1 Tax=Anianabacter salinae TaxID=2851023 RepID=UPI00225DDD27|nr:D-alanyl-D-alanine carboxypeptidase family protein [Anianabacter salinae]MBV0913210.1 D-alanyl-D-alanine carboxypeptidase [Anianabacter salinae]